MTCFIYKWTQISTSKWYIGSRTKKGCHPDDGYICSSKIVRPLIKENPNDWVRTILKEGTDPEYIRKLEGRFLRRIDAKNNSMSYNMDNGDGNFSTVGVKHSDETRRKMSESARKRVSKPHSDETRLKISMANKGQRTGRIISDESRRKMRESARNRVSKPHSDETRKKISESMKGQGSGRILSDEIRRKISESVKARNNKK